MRGLGRGYRSLPLVALSLAAVACGASKSSDPEVFNGSDSSTTDDDGFVLPDDGGDETDPGFEAGSDRATLEPNNATIFIDTAKMPLVGGTQTYVFKKPDGTDIASEATFTVDPATLGAFSGATFTSTTDIGSALGVTGIVTATAAGQSATAKITVVKLRKTEDPTTKAKDFFFTEPYMDAPDPKEDVLKFSTQINQVDVVFVMDTTGSMGGALSNLQSGLKSTLIPDLKKQIPSVGIGIAGHDDYPYSGYGSSGFCSGPFPGDTPVYVPQRVTTDEAKAKTGVDGLRLCYGGDGPEAQIPSMWHAVTGGALTWPSGNIPAHTPAPGTTGGMDFRAGAVPVIVSITDINWHNGVGSGSAYSFSAPTMAMLQDAFKKAGAKFVAVDTSTTPDADARALSDATSSNVPASAFGACTGGSGPCCTASGGAGRAADGPGGTCRLIFSASASGTGVTTSIVTAIKAIASGSVYDLLPEISNDPTNPDSVDAVVSFMDRLEAAKPGDPGVPAECAGTPRKSDPTKTYNDMIGGITAGKQVACFRVIPKSNTTVKPKDTAQFFKAKIRMRGVAPGTTPVVPSTPTIDLGDERVVLFYVPPKPPSEIH